MKSKAQRIISPIWANKIEVEIDGDTLLITGWGRLFGPLDGRTLSSQDIGRLDIFKRFRAYTLRQLGAERFGDSSGVYQFADATNDEKLISFVKEFGPVWGKVFSTVDDDETTIAITVTQSLKKLRREQEIFAAAVKLLQQLNLGKKADPAKLILAMASLLPPQMRPPDGFPRTGACRNFVTPLPAGTEVMTYPIAVRFAAIAVDLWCRDGFPSADKKPAIESLAPVVMCDLLNQHAPALAPFGREVIEMPVISNEGIRDALYFQMRLDYVAGRQIKACLNCGGYFPVLRRGARACGEGCRTALRNQKYWATHKKTVNRNRREKRSGRR